MSWWMLRNVRKSLVWYHIDVFLLQVWHLRFFMVWLLRRTCPVSIARPKLANFFSLIGHIFSLSLQVFSWLILTFRVVIRVYLSNFSNISIFNHFSCFNHFVCFIWFRFICFRLLDPSMVLFFFIFSCIFVHNLINLSNFDGITQLIYDWRKFNGGFNYHIRFSDLFFNLSGLMLNLIIAFLSIFGWWFLLDQLFACILDWLYRCSDLFKLEPISDETWTHQV